MDFFKNAKKIIFIIILSCFLFYGAFSFEYETLVTCDPHIFDECDKIVGNILNYSVHSDIDSSIDLNLYYSKKDIKCGGPLAVNLAYYDESRREWVILDSSINEVRPNTGNYMITAKTDYLGYLAIIRMDNCAKALFLSTKCSLTGGKAYELNPFSGVVGSDETISFTFCGFIPKCYAINDGYCDVNCPEGLDSECGKCTSGAQDCCLPSKDGICDYDCYERIDIDC